MITPSPGGSIHQDFIAATPNKMGLDGYITALDASGLQMQVCLWHHQSEIHQYIIDSTDNTQYWCDSGSLAVHQSVLMELQQIDNQSAMDYFYTIYDIDRLMQQLATLKQIDLSLYSDWMYHWY